MKVLHIRDHQKPNPFPGEAPTLCGRERSVHVVYPSRAEMPLYTAGQIHRGGMKSCAQCNRIVARLDS